jgi:RNA polymerase sigma factor (sigma-70 family)
MIEPTNTESRILFERSRSADAEAQQDLYDRYAVRLLALVRGRLNRQLQARFDAEDVVNSAFRSFFGALTGDRFALPSRGGLWPLLAQITLHKLHRSTQHHRRWRRSASRDECLSETSSRGHHDHDAVAELSLRDELTWLADKLPRDAATALELSIDGFSHEEIAGRLQCTSRTVRRYLAEARVLLRARLGQYADHGLESRAAATAADALEYDRYLLRRMIGAGAFGKVYLATDKTNGADVAVKYLRKRWAKDPRIVKRFAHETNLLARLKIAGVVPCFGGGSTGDGGRYLVMKWIDGQTLSERITQQRLEEAELRGQFSQLAECLQQVHAAGIIHCDLKPTNILIDQGGRWWLTDFGFARQATCSVGTLAGTPAYMAPEQLDPFYGPLGTWTDLYAVGKLILASVAGEAVGQACFTAACPTAEQILAECPAPISEELATIVRQLLQRRIEDRLASALDLARLLAGG